MNTTFSHALRVLLCPSCSAPLHVSPAGGEVVCDTCQETQVVHPRDERAQPETMVDVSEQLAQLAEQDPSPIVLPSVLAELTHDGALVAEKAPLALETWQRVRARLTSGQDADAEIDLYFLTRLLYERLLAQRDDMQLRALIETALETTRDPRYRQVFGCMLACEAARVGDITGAADWLAPCDPRSTDIHADSVYRYARAFVATRKRQPAKVLTALGRCAGQVPLATSFDAVASVYRADALERSGDLDGAVAELAGAMRRAGNVAVIDGIVRSSGDVALCRRSLVRAKTSLEPPRSRSTSPSRQSARRPRPWLLRQAGLHWFVLTVGFLGLAMVTSPTARTPSGHRLDLFFLAVGIAFAIPASLAWTRRGQRKGRKGRG